VQPEAERGEVLMRVDVVAVVWLGDIIHEWIENQQFIIDELFLTVSGGSFSLTSCSSLFSGRAMEFRTR
jgi:hypothetical protein